MSRNYNVRLDISNYNRELIPQIISAMDDYGLEAEEHSDGHIQADIDVNIGGGMLESEYRDEIFSAVWKVHPEYCDIELLLTYLDDPPQELYVSDEEIYQRLRSD